MTHISVESRKVFQKDTRDSMAQLWREKRGNGSATLPPTGNVTTLGKISAGKRGLCVRERGELVLARGLAQVVVVHDEVAFRVQLQDVLLDIRERSLLRIQLRLRLLDRSVHIGLRGLLVRDARNVLGTACLRVSHEPLVIRLRSLLLVLRGRQVTAQLLHEHVHERHDPVALAVLLLVSTPRLRRRRGRGVVERVGPNLGVHRLRRARDHLRRRRRDHVRPARCGEDLLLLRELLRRRFLVHGRAVELEQSVLRFVNQLQRRVALLLENDEVRVLLLALLRGLGDGFVHSLDLLLQLRDLLRRRGALRRGLLDERLARGDGLLGVFLLRAALFQVLVAERLRRIVVSLLLLEDFLHTIDHRKHLREVNLLRLQADFKQFELRRVRRTLARHRGNHTANAGDDGRRRSLLQQAELPRGSGGCHRFKGQGLLEEVQRVVIVQDLDRLADGGDLLCANLAALVPLLLLRRALRRQVREERLQVVQLLRRVLDVVGGRHDAHGQLAAALRLRLNRGRGGRDLLLLCGSKLLEARRGLLLVGDSAVQVLVHLVLHRLQDPDNLARRRAVVAERVLLPRQERQDQVPLVIIDGQRGVHDLRHPCGRRLRLQKRLAHALLQCGDRGVHRVQILLRIAGLLDEVRVLLLPDIRRLLQIRLGGFAVLLVSHEGLVELRLFGLLGLELRLKLRDLCPGLLSILGHLVRIAITVAHELVVELLLLFALGLELLLHILQQSHDFANGIRLHLQGESYTAPAAEEERGCANHRPRAVCANPEP